MGRYEQLSITPCLKRLNVPTRKTKKRLPGNAGMLHLCVVMYKPKRCEAFGIAPLICSSEWSNASFPLVDRSFSLYEWRDACSAGRRVSEHSMIVFVGYSLMIGPVLATPHGHLVTSPPLKSLAYCISKWRDASESNSKSRTASFELVRSLCWTVSASIGDGDLANTSALFKPAISM